MNNDDMACRELVEVVTEYLEGALPAARRASFEAHLTGCPGCREYLEQMRRTVRFLGRLTTESIPPEGQEELLRLFRRWKEGTTTV